MKNKIIFFILIALILAPAVFWSCGESTKSEDNNRETPSGQPQSEDEKEELTQAAEILPDLPEADFGGYEFTFLVRAIADAHWLPYNARDVYAEEETGDPINDAVYRRNRFVEGKYNCVIKEYRSANYSSDLQKTVKASDDTYSVYYAAIVDLAPATGNGLFHDLYSIPHLDLDAQWWDQNAVKSLSIGRRLFFAPSDLIIVDNDSTSTIVFNKKLIADHALDNPYELVHKNQWTLDKMIEMTRGVAQDINGDGVMDYTDKYGFCGYRDAAFSFLHAAGERIAKKDADDVPYFTLNTERFFTVLDRAYDLVYDPGSYNIHHLEGKFPEIYKISGAMFMEDRSLFYWILMHDIFDFRDMASDFGIIPIPKYDAGQPEYGHTVNHHHGHALAVPVSVADLERTGIILEALTAKSKYTLQPAYYEISLQRKFSRDEESEEMLDIIFASRVYDIGVINDWGNLYRTITDMTMKNNRNIASTFEKMADKAQKDVEKTIEKYEQIGR
ncbi:MAG: hypothetical protein FWD23_05250 [Oscillospiraceae bacterium]|nr:hypothetical protein [Oscillospiraceae bacterium]